MYIYIRCIVAPSSNKPTRFLSRIINTLESYVHRRLQRRRRIPRCHTFGLRSITFEGIHQFNHPSNFAEG